MTARSPDPRRLNVAAAAADAIVLEGRWPLAGFDRLIEGAAHDGDVVWSARGQSRRVASGEPEVWLHLAAQARVWRDCQRCLQPVALDLKVARGFRFVADEATAEALDAESDDDVLALPRRLDLHELVEDELLLALPVVPMHERCPVELAMSAGADTGALEPAPKPFAGLASLAGLRRGGKL
jgi:uncharacterized protein